jgi:hypothetical protein
MKICHVYFVQKTRTAAGRSKSTKGGHVSTLTLVISRLVHVAPAATCRTLIGLCRFCAENADGTWALKSHKGLPEKLLAKSASLTGFFLPMYSQHFKRHLARLHALVATAQIEVGKGWGPEGVRGGEVTFFFLFRRLIMTLSLVTIEIYQPFRVCLGF